jgi:hypothetical protein
MQRYPYYKQGNARTDVENRSMTKKHNSSDMTDDDDVVDWDSEPEIKEDAPEKRKTIDPAARRRIEQLLEERALRQQIEDAFDDD